MVNAAPETESLASETRPPSSEGDEPGVSQETPPLLATGEEAPGTGAEAPAGAARAPTSYTRPELDQLYREGKLTDPALVQRRDSLIQSDEQRRTFESQQLQRQQQEDEQRSAALEAKFAALLPNIQNSYQREIEAALNAGRDPDHELIAERLGAHLSGFRKEVSDIILEPLRRTLRTAVLYNWGDSVQNRRAVGALDENGLLEQLVSDAYQLGQRAGPGEGFVVKAQKDYDADLAGARKAAIDEWKAANPGARPPDTNGVRPAAATKKYIEMTRQELDALSDEERDRLINLEYGVRT